MQNPWTAVNDGEAKIGFQFDPQQGSAPEAW